MNNLQEQNELTANDVIVQPLQNTETAALAYAAAGISVLPLVLPEKKPAGISSWTHLQQTIATPEEIKCWFVRPDTQVGIICGKVSGSLEGIDFDEKYNIEPESLFARFKRVVDSAAPGLMDRIVIETTVSKGYHLFYRCDTIEGNQKLAQRSASAGENEDVKSEIRKAGQKTLIETRGAGGYFMCAPSAGYAVVQGSIENVPVITPEERTILLNAARGFNQIIEKAVTYSAPEELDSFDKLPGDDFNMRGDIRPVLRKAGWKKVGSHDLSEYWRRPGKISGISASLIKRKCDEPPVFVVYSTNAHPLAAGNHLFFSVYAHLEHCGDWSRAAAALAAKGFGSTTISKAEEYLSARYQFRLNVIRSRPEFRKIGDKEYKEIKDVELNSFYRQLQRYHIPIGVDVLGNLLHSDFVPSFDPFIEYYHSLPVWTVEQPDFIEQLAQTVALKHKEGVTEEQKKKENELFKEYLKKWLVNAVGCAVDPDITNHTALIFVGPQGYYKSTWLNRLVPKSLSSYKFIGTINPENKDTLLHLSECFLINLDELETLTKHTLGSLKSVMTLPSINVRRPYGHFNDNYVRRASFVGSINKTEFMNDETGSRRFLTFEIESVDAGHTVNMDDVHAQAYALFKSGYQYWFGRDEIQSINTRNKDFAVSTTEDELIAQCFEKVEFDKNNMPLIADPSFSWLTATQVAEKVKELKQFPVTTDSAKKFGIALVKAGFFSKRSNGKRYAVKERETGYAVELPF